MWSSGMELPLQLLQQALVVETAVAVEATAAVEAIAVVEIIAALGRTLLITSFQNIPRYLSFVFYRHSFGDFLP